MILLPDEAQKTVYKQEIEPHLTEGKVQPLPTALIFILVRLSHPIMWMW